MMNQFYYKTLIQTLIVVFLSATFSIPNVRAEIIVPLMPTPGSMVNLSLSFTPAHLKGIVINPQDALQFDFLIHQGDGQLTKDQKQIEYNKLIKYFLASLTVADQDQWVNLSPYESNRIIEDNFGKTEMGRDLLSQDYLLKQITSSLMYPESGLGKSFWDKVYEKAYQELGNTNIPVNTINKVWIVPDQAVIHENGNTAFIVKSHLKVLLESDYLAMQKSQDSIGIPRNQTQKQFGAAGFQHNEITNNIIRQIILPELEREINEGKNFAQLRQVFSGMILATWYKQALKESLLGQIYADKAKIKGVDLLSSPKSFIGDPDYIYQQYLSAFKKGVYNYIKEDADKYSKQTIPRKYFAGGVSKAMLTLDRAQVSRAQLMGDIENIQRLDDVSVNMAMVSPKDNSLKIYSDIDQAYNELPLDIKSQIESIAKEKGILQDKFISNLLKVMDKLAHIYAGMGLTKENYHNHLHHMLITYGSIILNADLIDNEKDMLVVYFGALFHDFHLREKLPEGKTKATAALVDETLGLKEQGGQLADLFGMKEYQEAIAADAQYQKFMTDVDKKDIQALFQSLTQAHGIDLNDLYAEINAVIRRTDFSSNKPESHKPMYKQKALEIRDYMDAQASIWVSNNRVISDKELNKLIKRVATEYSKIENVINKDKQLDANGKSVALAWMVRQRDIELSFLEALRNVLEPRRLKIYQMANNVELADQSAPTWLGNDAFNVQITNGLINELPVSLEANYPFFYVPQLLPTRVLNKMRVLPFRYKVNFINRMLYFARLATQTAKNQQAEMSTIVTSSDRFQKMLNAEKDWLVGNKEKVLLAFDLYDDGNIKEIKKENIDQVRVLKNSDIGDVLSLNEIIHLITHRAISREVMDEGHQIIGMGEKVQQAGNNDWFYVIAKGGVSVHTVEEVAELGEGNYFGELALIGDALRNATVTANTQTTVIRFSRSVFHGLMLSNSKFREKIVGRVPGYFRVKYQDSFWINPKIMMTLENNDDNSNRFFETYLSTEFKLPLRTVAYIKTLFNAAFNAYPDSQDQLKKVVIVHQDGNSSIEPVRIYQDPIDLKWIMIVTDQLLSSSDAQKALEQALSRGGIFDRAMQTNKESFELNDLGGIDFNATYLDLQIKRDSNGVPLPMALQDKAMLEQVPGFVPVILEIKPFNQMLIDSR